MNQTFLLQEVIDDLVNTDKSLSAALIKLNYFGRLIKNQELIDYTQNELNGYKNSKESVPDYRKAIGTLYIDMQAYYNRHSVLVHATLSSFVLVLTMSIIACAAKRSSVRY